MHEQTRSIVPRPRRRPFGLALCGLLAACGGGSAASRASAPAPQPGTQLPRNQLLVLEEWGAAPADTAVTIATGRSRTIVLRHGAPDNTVFATLRLPDSLWAPGADSARITIEPLPGIYGVHISSSVPWQRQAILTFKYPVHFSAPAAARLRYDSDFSYERALAVTEQGPDGRYTLLASDRPATDNLAARIPAPGAYVVAAPR